MTTEEAIATQGYRRAGTRCPKCNGQMFAHTEHGPHLGDISEWLCAQCGYTKPVTPLAILPRKRTSMPYHRQDRIRIDAEESGR